MAEDVEARRSPRLRLAGSLAGGSLLVSWESLLDSGWRHALARIDCLGGR